MKSIKKKEKQGKPFRSKYSSRKTKARNFLINLSYRLLNKNDHLNVSFVIYCISFITQDLNALSLERKFISQADQQYVYMQWEKCIPNEFYRFICQNISFIALNQLHVTHVEQTILYMNLFLLRVVLRLLDTSKNMGLYSNMYTVCCFQNL